MNSLKSNIKKTYNSEYFPFIILGLIIFLLIIRVQLLGGDDLFFKQELAENKLLPWLNKRYYTWSGRMSIEFALGIFNFNLFLWKIINPLVVIIYMIGISNYFTPLIDDEKIRRTINAIVCCCFFLFYPYVITSSVMWYTGSFYYLWSTAALLIALLPFYYEIIGRKQIYKISTIAYFLATAYAAYMEQALAILLCFGTIIIIYLKIVHKKIPKALIVQYIFMLVNIIICIASPGTRVRSGIELHWYPEFEMLTVVDKIFQSINWTNQHIITGSNLLFFILTFLIGLLFFKKYKNDKLVITIGNIPLLFSIIQLIPFNNLMNRISNYQHGNTNNLYQTPNLSYRTFDIETALDSVFYNTRLANPSNLNTGILSLLPAIFCLSIILLISVLLAIVIEKKEIKISIILLYLAGLASGYILAFSPTIFASGNRIFFITDSINLMIIGILLKELATFVDLNKNKYIIRFKYGLIVVVALIIINYLVSFVNYYPWL